MASQCACNEHKQACERCEWSSSDIKKRSDAPAALGAATGHDVTVARLPCVGLLIRRNVAHVQLRNPNVRVQRRARNGCHVPAAEVLGKLGQEVQLVPAVDTDS